jgi:radical SAM superfamily enzyme YgiQ (UPF0313 family)
LTATSSRPLVLLLQLAIPPAGAVPVRNNIPLAAGYLKLLARKRGFEKSYHIELLPVPLVNTGGDQGLVEAILAREPWMVGFTCYVWNIDRTLWIAEQLKRRRPDLWIVVGGPEITEDNAWVLEQAALDYAVVGEGEQTFAELLSALEGNARPPQPIPGLRVLPDGPPPLPRTPLAQLDEISSPYLDGILDAADERTLFLETVRGCAFRCRFCYYPKSYDSVYAVSAEKVLANLRHAAERGAEEVVILDPTLNQRRDFLDFLRLLARGNPNRQFTYFAELRAEGIDAESANLLRAANFSEVEVGLQSVDRRTQQLMDRPVNLRAVQRGVQAMLDTGIRVKVDLIIGLPGDTVDSVRRGLDFINRLPAGCGAQVFQLSILPGTAFRHDVQQLGLTYQPRPPYYVLGTPTLTLEQMVELMDEAQEALDLEFDPLPPPAMEWPCDEDDLIRRFRVDLDAAPCSLPPTERRAQAFVLWLRSAEFAKRSGAAADLIARVLADNPHTTLQVTLEPTACPEQLTADTLEPLRAACFRSLSYLDRFYCLQPSGRAAAKRLVVLVPLADRARLGMRWVETIGEYAALVWRAGSQSAPPIELDDFESLLP